MLPGTCAPASALPAPKFVAIPRNCALLKPFRGIANRFRPEGVRRAVVRVIAADTLVHVQEGVDSGGVDNAVAVAVGRVLVSYFQQGRYRLVLAAFYRYLAAVTIEDSVDGCILKVMVTFRTSSALECSSALASALLRVASADDVWLVTH